MFAPIRETLKEQIADHDYRVVKFPAIGFRWPDPADYGAIGPREQFPALALPPGTAVIGVVEPVPSLQVTTRAVVNDPSIHASGSLGSQ